MPGMHICPPVVSPLQSERATQESFSVFCEPKTWAQIQALSPEGYVTLRVYCLYLLLPIYIF